MNIKYVIGKVFGSRERAYYMGVNDQFDPRRKIDHVQHLTMNLENVGMKFIITYRHIVIQKKQLISEKTGKSGQEVMYSSKCFNFNYMEFFGYETRERLIFTQVEGRINKKYNQKTRYYKKQY